MDNQTNISIITSLMVDNEPPTRPKHTPPWKTPFLELLGLLKIIDNSQPNPKVDGQRFCFQPSPDLSKISRIFLSVSISSAQFDIDLKTIRILGSDVVPPAVNKLQEYANHVLRRVRLFRDRLLERAVIDDPTCFLYVDLFTCPLCHDPLVNCVDCDSKVACPKPMCLGHLIVDFELCYEHKRMACHACLTKNDTVPPLICCPMCQGWCCREDTNWCAGLIIHPAIGTEELAELSRECEWDSETIIRSHPPKPGPCRFCAHYELPSGWEMCQNSVDDLEADRCPSQTPFMTQIQLPAAHCPECIDQSPGCRCACGVTWICDTCSVIGNKSTMHPFLLACPRCGVNYCNECESSCGNYIELCRGCKGVTLCKDCQEEEVLPGDVQTDTDDGRPEPAVFTVQCSFCGVWSCAECHVSQCTVICSLCGGWFCYTCNRNAEADVIQYCLVCGDCVCVDCRVNHRSCPGDIMLRNMPP